MDGERLLAWAWNAEVGHVVRLRGEFRKTVLLHLRPIAIDAELAGDERTFHQNRRAAVPRRIITLDAPMTG